MDIITVVTLDNLASCSEGFTFDQQCMRWLLRIHWYDQVQNSKVLHWTGFTLLYFVLLLHFFLWACG